MPCDGTTLAHPQMDIREADPADARAVSEVRQLRAVDFPSADALLSLRGRLDILMPVARVDTEIVGFALAVLVTAEEGRLGTVRYLFALVDEGPVAWAIKAALLSRLEQQCGLSTPMKSNSAPSTRRVSLCRF